MTIAILSAMAEENASLVAQMHDKTTTEIAHRHYHQGTLWGLDVVLVFSHWGKVAAASTATILITQFNVTEILFTGVAGAIDSSLNIGDIVVGNQIYQHDMDVRPIIERHEIPLLGVAGMSASAQRVKELSEAARQFLDTEFAAQLSSNTLKEFSLHKPKVLIAGIASGDQFISSEDNAADIHRRLPDVACVEMEGGAVAQVCTEFNIPFSIVRTVSDSANNNAPIDFPKFIENVAQVYSLGILKRLFKP